MGCNCHTSGFHSNLLGMGNFWCVCKKCDLHATRLAGKGWACIERGKNGERWDFTVLPQLYHLSFAVASFMVEHMMCQNKTNVWHFSTPHCSLADMWGCVVASRPPLHKKGFQPELKGPQMSLFCSCQGLVLSEERGEGTGSNSFSSISKCSGVGEVCKA